MNNNFKVFYTVSDVGNMIYLLMKSLKSINKFINKENIIVRITPPYRKDKNYYKILEYANIEFDNNITNPFYMNVNRKARFGEKLSVCFVDSENVIFLDHDTIIVRDIKEILNDDYDVAFRMAHNWQRVYNINEWNKYMISYRKTPIPMINAGFIIFKNNAHKKISKQVFEIFEDENMLIGTSKYNLNYKYCQHRDQIALSVACANLNIRWLDRLEHCFRWSYEIPRPRSQKPYVIHGENNLNKIRALMGQIIKWYMTTMRY